jgi:hypothetical protein
MPRSDAAEIAATHTLYRKGRIVRLYVCLDFIYRHLDHASSLRDFHPRERLQKLRRMNCVPSSVINVKRAAWLPEEKRVGTACSAAAGVSWVRQLCERFHPMISRVQQSIRHHDLLAVGSVAPAALWLLPVAETWSANGQRCDHQRAA